MHLLGYLHVLDLDHAHLYAPGFGLLVYYGLKLGVYGLTVGEQIVQIFLALYISPKPPEGQRLNLISHSDASELWARTTQCQHDLRSLLEEAGVRKLQPLLATYAAIVR